MNDKLRRGPRGVTVSPRGGHKTAGAAGEGEPEIKGHGEGCGFMFSVTSGGSDVGVGRAQAQSVRFCTFQFQGWEKHRLFVD